MGVPGKKTSITFQTVATSSDGAGGQIEAAPVLYDTIRGVWSTLSRYERLIVGAPGEAAEFIAYLKYNTTTAGITTKMEAVVGSDRFEVMDIDNPGNLNDHLEVSCRRKIT